ncbi:MAG: sigma 54-interacting transcriptional regulator [Gemmatimonadetes bacterium]|nr:sigma 54-interacting transcriptional regulator [Gemmatimonadota bacterium]MBT5587289.1 sigma 54-interacting transcriptional regulator [Gemmatimonadota bacterium]MBT5960446.1 sigma 54-interacting transcriptional regulator [Gemmatimonadota bacterium]MBT6630265.1 sigma 54-interacting transcriptional regulator [Gemmatimonadota bacterium]MBT7454236.1 sigma 54-interacting transcriptional regulator [Gemmatimonadota bacterium]
MKTAEIDLDVRGARILVVDDTPANLTVLCQALEDAGYRVMVAGDGLTALEIAGGSAPDLILLDVMMPGIDGYETCRRLQADEQMREIPVVFLTANDETVAVVEGFQAGGIDYVVKPFRKEEVLARIQTHLERALLARRLTEKLQELAESGLSLERAHEQLQQSAQQMERVNAQLQEEVGRRRQLTQRLSHLAHEEAERWGIDGFIGRSPTLQKVLRELDLLQSADGTSVLITGESGTGKELIARAVHARSGRCDETFVAVNCATVPRELAESVFFGHRKGAFTGAERDQVGYFELAHGGTLFLDEIGDMPADLQSKLLRVLEDGVVTPIGATESLVVDVRVIAATHVDLSAALREGRFREDLYYRLARFTVELPPLRQRREDIPLLSQHMLEQCAAQMKIAAPVIAPDAMERLQSYEFPGNVRELRNIIERAMILCDSGPIQTEHLQFRQETAVIESGDTRESDAGAGLENLPLNLGEAEAILVRRAVDLAEGNVSKAARLLGIDRNKVYRKLAQDGERPTS